MKRKFFLFFGLICAFESIGCQTSKTWIDSTDSNDAVLLCKERGGSDILTLDLRNEYFTFYRGGETSFVMSGTWQKCELPKEEGYKYRLECSSLLGVLVNDSGMYERVGLKMHFAADSSYHFDDKTLWIDFQTNGALPHSWNFREANFQCNYSGKTSTANIQKAMKSIIELP